MKYQRKPIKAIQYMNNLNAIKTFCGGKVEEAGNPFRDLLLQTPNGTVVVSTGDYVVKESNGNLYASKREYFENQFEKVAK